MNYFTLEARLDRAQLRLDDAEFYLYTFGSLFSPAKRRDWEVAQQVRADKVVKLRNKIERRNERQWKRDVERQFR